MVKLPSRDLVDVRVVGIPRGLLYYRYGAGWRTFFEALGRTVVLSPATDKAIVDAGTALSVDECCLASKAYMGHVSYLAHRCDAVFVPSYGSCDPRAGFCTKFQSLTDLATNTFAEQNLRVIQLLVENISDKTKCRTAFMDLGMRLGASAAEAKRACKAAEKAQVEFDAHKASAQADVLAAAADAKAQANAAGRATDAPLVILVAAHPYIAHDRYLAGSVVDALQSMGAVVVYADETNHDRTFKASFDFSQTMPWRINRELIGSILTLQDQVDGIVLVSAFPCGPDSMTDDAVMRCIQGTPMLNLMIDAQSGTAGVETRVESFVDILKFQRQGGYVHA